MKRNFSIDYYLKNLKAANFTAYENKILIVTVTKH